MKNKGLDLPHHVDGVARHRRGHQFRHDQSLLGREPIHFALWKFARRKELLGTKGN